MRTFFGIIVCLLLAFRAEAATVTALWNASIDPVNGYRVFYGLMQGSENESQIDVGPALQVVMPNLLPGRTYFVHVRAYNAGGMSIPSEEVSFVVPQNDPCAFPLGATSVSIFPTGKLNKSGGPGSKAYILFQVASPNSPIVFLSVRANGIDVPDSISSATGPNDRLNSPGSLWFTIPQGTMNYSIYARNAAGCFREQPTGFKTP